MLINHTNQNGTKSNHPTPQKALEKATSNSTHQIVSPNPLTGHSCQIEEGVGSAGPTFPPLSAAKLNCKPTNSISLRNDEDHEEDHEDDDDVNGEDDDDLTDDGEFFSLLAALQS